MNAIKDLIRYFKLRKRINHFKKQPEFIHLGLGVDWLGRIYKVINLPKEYAGDEGVIRNSLALDMSLQYSDYLLDIMKIGDDVFQAMESKSKISYLFVWSPIFRFWTTNKLVYTLIIILITSIFGGDIFNYILTLFRGFGWLL